MWHGGARAGDDTINIQSSFYTIVALNPANHTVTLGGVGHKDLFSPGENVTAYMSDGVSLGSALITKVTGVPAPYPAGTKVKLFNPANPMVLSVNDISIEVPPPHPCLHAPPAGLALRQQAHRSCWTAAC